MGKFMEACISQKEILRTPMNRQEYNDYRGWTLPEDENGDDEGYLIEYLDGGHPNHEKHKGYISWSPKDVSDRNCIPAAGPFLFGEAIKQVNCGKKVARPGWNGKSMFLLLIVNWDFTTDVSGVDELDTLPFICMKTADNKLVPWVASQTDKLAEDWHVVE